MADRNVAGSNTFEQFRVEFNELATDVGDIASITGATGRIASASDVIEAVVAINSQLPTNITFTANEIDVDTGDLLIDVENTLTLDSGMGEIELDRQGTEYGKLDAPIPAPGAPQNLRISSSQQDADLILSGNDGGSTINALTLDMSESGKAIFNKDIQLNNSGVISNGSVNLSFPTVGGAISTEGFSIALATALG